MKKYIFIIVLTSCLFITGKAQEIIKEGQMEIEGVTYKIQYAELYPRIIISSMDNKYREGYPEPTTKMLLPIEPGDIALDTTLQRKIILKVLHDKEETLRSNKERLSIYYVFERDGKPVNIDFGLNRNTKITPEEINVIDSRLREEIRATFKGIAYKDYPVLFFSWDITF